MVGSTAASTRAGTWGKNWKFVANLPVTQFYKVAVDYDEPFYNVYGGTQDNNTQGGPSRTDNIQRHPQFERLVHHPVRRRPPASVSSRDQPRHRLLGMATGKSGPGTTRTRPARSSTSSPSRSPAIRPSGSIGTLPILVSPHSIRTRFSTLLPSGSGSSDDRGDSWRADLGGPHPAIRIACCFPSWSRSVEPGVVDRRRLGSVGHVQLQRPSPRWPNRRSRTPA